jgi:gamma-glutamylcysteine synthetase
MKRFRWVALIVLFVALVAILAAGFLKSVMHQEPHPIDSHGTGRRAESMRSSAYGNQV